MKVVISQSQQALLVRVSKKIQITTVTPEKLLSSSLAGAIRHMSGEKRAGEDDTLLIKRLAEILDTDEQMALDSALAFLECKTMKQQLH